MKTPKLTKIKNRYELASIAVLQKLPYWKQEAVKDDVKNRNDSRVMDEYAAEVVKLAESDAEIFVTTE